MMLYIKLIIQLDKTDKSILIVKDIIEQTKQPCTRTSLHFKVSSDSRKFELKVFSIVHSNRYIKQSVADSTANETKHKMVALLPWKL